MSDFFKALIILAILGILIWMLMDLLNRPFKKNLLRALWFLILTFIPVLGMIAYYFMVMRKNETNS